MDAELESRLEAFRAHCDAVMVAHWERSGYTKHSTAPTHELDVGEKWAKIFAIEYGRRGRIVAFIALNDFENKTIGVVKKGGIYKPASYKLPAKHSRGNLFLPNFGNCMDNAGNVNYMR